MNRKELLKIHNLQCRNIQWSWAFVNHSSQFIVLQLFSEQNKNKVYSPTWGKTNQASHKELESYINLVLTKNYDIKIVQATGYHDLQTNLFKLTGYHSKTLIDARLEIDTNGDMWYFPVKDNMPKIIYR
jgi:hypothetical protein